MFRNLSELQLQLKQLGKELERISGEVEEMKPQTGDSMGRYGAMDRIAQESPIKNPYLLQLEERTKKNYFVLISGVLCQKAGARDQGLQYLCCLAVGAGCDLGAEQLERLGMESGTWKLKEMTAELISKTGISAFFLADLLMAIHMDGPCESEVLYLAAELITVLGIHIGDVRIMTQLTNALLRMDQEAFDQIVSDKPYPGMDYLIPKSWLKKYHRCVYQFSRNRGIFCDNITAALAAADPKAYENAWKRELKYPLLSCIRKGNMITEICQAPSNGVLIMAKNKENVTGLYVINYFESPYQFCSSHGLMLVE